MARLPRNLLAALRHDLVISALAVVSVGIGLYELGRPRPDRAFTLLDGIDLAIVAIFIADFAWHASRSGEWKRYARERWWELPSLIPITGGMIEGLDGFALVRGVRLVRVVRIARVLRILSTTPRFRRSARYVRRIAARSQVGRIALAAAAVVGVGATALFAAEAQASASVAGFGDAVWWATRAFFSGAYEPATAWGRLLVSTLHVVGIVFVGVFVASLTNAIVKEPEPDEDAI